MKKKTRGIFSKLLVANVAAGLAMASLVTIGFAAWAEVKESNTDINGVSINVENHSEYLQSFDYTAFTVYQTGVMQSDANRNYTTTPHIYFYFFFKLRSEDMGARLTSTYYLNCDSLFIPNTGFTYKYASTNTTITKTVFDNYYDSNESFTTGEAQTICDISATYLTIKIDWTFNIDSNYKNYIDFYNYVSNKESFDFTLDIYSEVTR